MKTIRHLTTALVVLALGSSAAVPRLPAPATSAPDANPLALTQGLEAGLQAYARAADAYAGHALQVPAVALWVLALAAVVVLLEWVLARGSAAPGG